MQTLRIFMKHSVALFSLLGRPEDISLLLSELFPSHPRHELSFNIAPTPPSCRMRCFCIVDFGRLGTQTGGISFVARDTSLSLEDTRSRCTHHIACSCDSYANILQLDHVDTLPLGRCLSSSASICPLVLRALLLLLDGTSSRVITSFMLLMPSGALSKASRFSRQLFHKWAGNRA